MPRKSAASLTVVQLDGRASRLRPPASLSDPERAIFVDLVESCQASHFRKSDLPLLVRYAEACALADLAAEHLRKDGPVIFGKPSAWLTVQGQALKSMVALSMRLRLSPQSRLDPKTAAREKPPLERPPWEI